MNRDNINKTIFWSLLYIFLYSACTVIVNLYLSNLLLLAVGVSGAVYIILNMFCIQYKKGTSIYQWTCWGNVSHVYWNMAWKTA